MFRRVCTIHAYDRHIVEAPSDRGRRLVERGDKGGCCGEVTKGGRLWLTGNGAQARSTNGQFPFIQPDLQVGTPRNPVTRDFGPGNPVRLSTYRLPSFAGNSEQK